MTIPQLTSGKFACYGLSTRASGEFDEPVLFDDGLYASASPPFFIVAGAYAAKLCDRILSRFGRGRA